MNYQRVKHIKARIDKLKTEILEGVQIRTKVQEIKYGETPSSFLVGKQSSEGKRKTIYQLTAEESYGNIIQGQILNTTDNINEYAYKFYSNLYAHQAIETTEQTDFLNTLEPKIGERENEILIKTLDLDDIVQALNPLAHEYISNHRIVMKFLPQVTGQNTRPFCSCAFLILLS